jgi:hypothetical protein
MRIWLASGFVALKAVLIVGAFALLMACAIFVFLAFSLAL